MQSSIFRFLSFLIFYLFMLNANAYFQVETINGGPNGYAQVYRTETWDGNQFNTCVLCSNPGNTSCPYTFEVNRSDIELINKLFEGTLNRIKSGRLTGRVVTVDNLTCEWISSDANSLNSKIRVYPANEPILQPNN